MNFFDLIRPRKSKSKKNCYISANEISQPCDFRVEMHIGANSSVQEIMAFTNGSSLPSRPTILTPDPNGLSAEARRLCRKTPLTEDELTKSPFGRYIPSPRRTAIQRKYGTANAANTLIPSAPSRYRDSIPPEWMDPLNNGIVKNITLPRSHSKSFPELRLYADDSGAPCSCEVCKKGTVTNLLYFPTATPRALKLRVQQDVKAKLEDDDYYEIHSRNSERNLRLSILQNGDKTTTSSLTKASMETKPTKTLPIPPSPPPRRIFNNAREAKALDFSPIKTVCSTEWSSLNGSLTSESKSTHSKSTRSGSDRLSMESGISEKQSEAEETFMTRL